VRLRSLLANHGLPVLLAVAFQRNGDLQVKIAVRQDAL
jgi:hypothetical protein